MDAAAARRAMVDQLVARGLVRNPRLRDALLAVPRERFVPPEAQGDAHRDAPTPLPGGQTVSAPHMVAMMCEALDPRPGDRVLEVGGGSGYHAALLAHLVAPGGRIATVEVRHDLAEGARRVLAALPLPTPVEVVVGDGSLGHPALAPYDRISVACAAPHVPPPLVDQLAPGGVLVIPVGGRDVQDLLRIRRDGAGGVQRDVLGPCRFVPLVGAHGFPA